MAPLVYCCPRTKLHVLDILLHPRHLRPLHSLQPVDTRLEVAPPRGIHLSLRVGCDRHRRGRELGLEGKLALGEHIDLLCQG